MWFKGQSHRQRDSINPILSKQSIYFWGKVVILCWWNKWYQCSVWTDDIVCSWGLTIHYAIQYHSLQCVWSNKCDESHKWPCNLLIICQTMLRCCCSAEVMSLFLTPHVAAFVVMKGLLWFGVILLGNLFIVTKVHCLILSSQILHFYTFIKLSVIVNWKWKYETHSQQSLFLQCRKYIKSWCHRNASNQLWILWIIRVEIASCSTVATCGLLHLSFEILT